MQIAKGDSFFWVPQRRLVPVTGHLTNRGAEDFMRGPIGIQDPGSLVGGT